MNKHKSIIVAICLAAGIAQAPAARAQAQLVAPLLQLGMQIAGQVLPMAVPVVAGGGMLIYQAGSTIPAYVKERVSLPHFGAKKKVAEDPPVDPNATSDKTPTMNVSGNVMDQERATAANKAAAKNETAEPDSNSYKASAENDTDNESSAAAKPNPAPSDPSKWYLEK